MDKNHQTLFKKIDSIQLYVPDLDKGIDYYCNLMGLKIIWKTENAIGLGLAEDVTELVIQNQRKHQEIDIKVENVLDAIDKIQNSGGKILYGPFDIKIGKCAVIKDPWNNEYVILDSTKGTFITDEDGQIIGQRKP